MNRLIGIGVRVIIIILLYLGFQLTKDSMGFEDTALLGICLILLELLDIKYINKNKGKKHLDKSESYLNWDNDDISGSNMKEDE